MLSWLPAYTSLPSLFLCAHPLNSNSQWEWALSSVSLMLIQHVESVATKTQMATLMPDGVEHTKKASAAGLVWRFQHSWLPVVGLVCPGLIAQMTRLKSDAWWCLNGPSFFRHAPWTASFHYGEFWGQVNTLKTLRHFPQFLWCGETHWPKGETTAIWVRADSMEGVWLDGFVR